MNSKNGYWFIWYFKIGLSTIQLYELNCSMTIILIDIDRLYLSIIEHRKKTMLEYRNTYVDNFVLMNFYSFGH